jgi:hypothetical protein
MAFLAGGGRKTVLELGRLPEVPSLNGRCLAPLQLHIAVDCTDPLAETERLIAVGAEWVGESHRNSCKGEKILVRDPWGYTIQMLNRKEKLLRTGSEG